jgi:hypothetical protein
MNERSCPQLFTARSHNEDRRIIVLQCTTRRRLAGMSNHAPPHQRKEHMIRRMTFQERTLAKEEQRSRLAAKLLEAVRFGEEWINSGAFRLVLLHQHNTMKEVAKELLQMK